MLTLSNLHPGQRATMRNIHIHGARPVRQRLLDMGMRPNATVELERVAPTGNPVWIRVANAQISLRSAEASNVEVEIL